MRRFLIVDDNEAFAENLAEILRDAGHEVEVALTGERALELVRRGGFDALITDMRMPAMSGADLMSRLRRLDSGLPALAVTAYTGFEELERARREGLLAILPKPVPLAQLMELLETARRDAVVAIVEDDAQLCENLEEALRMRGFTALTATSVRDAERLGLRPFAALVDLRMPGGPDGEALRRINERFPDLPTFVITAHADRVPDVPHQGFFAKPFNTGELLGALERLHAESGRRA